MYAKSKRDASAAAYFYLDEPESNLLASLFGLYNVKVESPDEVITISNNTEIIVISDSVIPAEPIRGKPYESPADSDEVTSPMPGPSNRVCRKLFDVDIARFPDLSTPNSASRATVGGTVILSSPKGYSCASWSPVPNGH